MSGTLDDRRRQQVELYGDSVDVIAQHAHQLMGVDTDELADVIGLSAPMLTRLVGAERIRIGNPVAIARLTRLREFAEELMRGEAHREDIPLTLAQIKASTTPARPSRVTGPTDSVPGPTQGRGPESTARRTPASNPSGGVAVVPSAGSPPALSPTSLGYARTVVGQHVPPTPAYRWPLLERFTGVETWTKHENHTPTGSFKVRGALNLMERLRVHHQHPAGLVSASNGNLGQGLAFAGQQYGVPVVVVVPEGNNPDHNAAMEAFGAEVVVHGEDYQAAREHAAGVARDSGLMMVPPFHPWLVEGIATSAAELHEAVPGLDVVYVPVGMGSGICAHILVRDLLGRRVEIVGVVAAGAPAYARSFAARRPLATATAETFVDGVACRTPDPSAVEAISRGASRILQVDEADAAEAMALVYRTTHNVAEPAGSLAVAGLLADRERVAGRRVAVIHSGGNADFDVLARVTAENT